MLKSGQRFDTWEPQFLQCLLDTATWKFLYAMQCITGTVAKDYSGNAFTGTYTDVALNQFAPNRRINKTALFNGASSKITLPKTASVRGLGAFTIIAVVNVKPNANLKWIWQETVNDGSLSRCNIYLDSDEKLGISIRTGKNAGVNNAIISTFSLPSGFCILHATIDIPNDAITLYRNGIPLASSSVIDFGSDTIIEDTEPYSTPYIGARSAGDWFNSNLAYVGVANSLLSDAVILQQTKAGGFV